MLSKRDDARTRVCPLRRKPHPLQGGAAEDAVGIAQRLVHLEVVVAFAEDKLDRLAGGLRGSREVAALALELGRLVAAIEQRERSHQAVEMARGAQLLLAQVGEAHIG